MALGRKDVTVTRTNGGADIFRLAGLFGDDNLICHHGLVWWTGFAHPERIVNYRPTASHPLAGLRQGGKTVEKEPPSGPARRRCRRSRLRRQHESLLAAHRRCRPTTIGALFPPAVGEADLKQGAVQRRFQEGWAVISDKLGY